MRHWLTVSLIALSTSAAAETVSFQSGEHDTFTRLVATLPSPNTQWQLSGQGRTYTITVDGTDLQFVTDTIFSRIPRTRLSNIVTDNASGTVRLDLACDCVVESQPFNDQYVIFDIREGTANEHALPEDFTLNRPDITTPEPREPGFFKWATPTPVTDKPQAKPAPVEPVVAVVDNPTQQFDAYVRNEEKVSRIAQQVIDQINRATEQNLLTANVGQSDAQNPPAKRTPGQTMAQVQEAPKPQKPATSNVSTYNAMDVAAQEIAAALAGQSGTSQCIPDSRLDIEAWGGTQGFSTELGRLRSELVGEFDLTTSESMKELAQFYVAHTFGTEAQQILRNLPADERDPVLNAIAELVEIGSVSAENPFVDQGHCASSVAFWAALSGEQLTGKSAVDSALGTLSGLPLNLREHLAPHLSNRFVELGHVEAASMVLNTIQRVNPKQGPEFALAQATVHSEMGEDAAAIEKLEAVAAANSSMAPAALVELIATHFEQDREVLSETIALVSALAVEHKAGMMGAELRIAHARARTLSQDFTTAFEVIDEIARIDGAEAAVAPRSEVVTAMMAKSDGFDILSFTVSQKLSEPEALNTETAFALAETMYDLGFLDQTKRLVQAMNVGHSTPELHLLKARVALADDLPRRAEAELMNLTGSEADTLRAKARSMAGDHAAASEILSAMGDTENAAFEAWLAGDISGLSALEIEVYQRIESMMTSAGVAAPGATSPQGVLGRNRDLLNGSVEARDVLTELLDLHQISSPAS